MKHPPPEMSCTKPDDETERSNGEKVRPATRAFGPPSTSPTFPFESSVSSQVPPRRHLTLLRALRNVVVGVTVIAILRPSIVVELHVSLF